MHAMLYQSAGQPDRIVAAEVPAPRPAANQLLVKLAASSVNPVDWKLRRRQSFFYRPVTFPSIPGADLAGEVTEVGARVRGFKPGDRVFAMGPVTTGATSAEYAVVDETSAALAPANLPLAECAAIPLAALTALQSLRDLGRIAAGQRVLIVGASGGVGHFAVQIAKSYGTHVTAVCGSRHVDMVRALGADVVIDHTRQPDFRAVEPYDLVFDTAVRAPMRDFLAVLAPAGAYVSTLPDFGRVSAAILLPFISRRRVRFSRVRARGADLDVLRELCEAGKLKPVIDKTFPLAELAAAHVYSQQGHAGGKILITIG
jgi:2-desacetyl-2-hydroxyethyl bacteriochlorophyllide A dehydrogenase